MTFLRIAPESLAAISAELRALEARLDNREVWCDCLTIPAWLLKPRCDLCGELHEPSEMVASIPAGTDVRAACLQCWNYTPEGYDDIPRLEWFL